MKRLIVFFISTTLVLSMKFLCNNDFSSFNNFERMTIVTKNEMEIESENISYSGNQIYYTLNHSQAEKYLENEKKQDIDGYVFYFNDFDLDAFSKLIGGYMFCSEGVENYKIYYGYYKQYNDFRYVSGKKINFQLVKRDNDWVLGFPLILTGF